MSFESVNVSRLKSAINSCKNNINYNDSSELINKISNNNTWNTESRNNLKNALQILINQRYGLLKEHLNKASIIADKIERWQWLKRHIENDLKPHLYYYTTDENGHEERHTNHNIERQINACKAEQNRIISEINSMLGAMENEN